MAVQDKKIMERLAKNNIILEICPTSNLKNSKLKNIKELKTTIRTLLDNDVKLTLNTD
jgi:adenosine deaminase